MKPNRKLAVASVKRNVAALVRANRRGELRGLMEHTGFLSNTDHSNAELAAAIVALAGVVELSWFTCIVHGAAFYREQLRGREKGRWERAVAAGKAACAACGLKLDPEHGE